MDHNIVAQNPERFTLIKDDFQVSKQVGIICNISKIYNSRKETANCLWLILRVNNLMILDMKWQ